MLKNIVYLKFQFHCVSCVLSGKTKYGKEIIEDREREEIRLINIPTLIPVSRKITKFLL